MYHTKKLVIVLATSMLVTASLEAIPLQCVPCLSYPVQFQGEKVRALIDSGRKVNTMTPAYALIPNLRVHLIDVRA